MSTATRNAASAQGSRLARDGVVLALVTMCAHAGNYVLNLALARWLSPAAFADANLMVTLMALTTALALGLQLVVARAVGRYEVAGDEAHAAWLTRRLHRWSWGAGLTVAALLILGAPYWQHLLRTESAWPFVILGAGMPFYLAMSVGRGVLQGRLAFRRLGASLLVEVLARIVVTVGLLQLGGGATAASAGLTASFVVTWWLVRRTVAVSEAPDAQAAEAAEVRRHAALVAVFLAGQTLITNGDVLIAKHFLDPVTAGSYSAVSLLGRSVFFLTWSVATVVFPAVARRHAAGEGSSGLLRGGVAVVFAIGALCTLGSALFGGQVLHLFLGDGYPDLTTLLTGYVLGTTFFAVANLIASHHLAAGRSVESWALLAGALIQTVLMLMWHHGPAELVNAQTAAKAGLLLIVAACPLVTLSSRKLLVEGTTAR
ncbi:MULTISPECIES: oligosaccharide flippase family protein [Actinoplanes]|uniref:oligosaccharide flippase family protein n=1 Tax=Actinoplanes TaxID=1865 RepID=UPI0005F2E79A|nr:MULTISPECIES: oligosaccharide flippase family protein [Actinoplanes]GLX99841.1 hypothetical protein Acsp01_02210 [Actinoplanes sp. NBRC 101535]